MVLYMILKRDQANIYSFPISALKHMYLQRENWYFVGKFTFMHVKLNSYNYKIKYP